MFVNVCRLFVSCKKYLEIPVVCESNFYVCVSVLCECWFVFCVMCGCWFV